MNIYLCGFQGSGKTAFGKKAARLMGFSFCDIDEEMLRGHKEESIRQLYKNVGEILFRDIEEKVVAKMSVAEKRLIALGGGSLEREKNRLNINNSGTLLYLYRPYDLLFYELTKRPLPPYLTSYAHFSSLFQRRHEHFMALSKEAINVSEKTEHEIIERIVSYGK